MHILQLCKKFPYPLKDGESIAVTYLSKGFKELGCEISLLAMNTSKHYTDIDKLPDSFSHYKEIRCTYLDNEVKALGAVKNLFTRKSFHLTRFRSKEFEEELISMLEENDYDIVQIESLYLAQYIDTIKAHSYALVVMRAHNVEHEIWDRVTTNTRSLPKRLYLKYLTKKLQNAETEYLSKYDYLVAISGRDLKKFRKMGYNNGATVAPIGVEMADYIPLKIQNLHREIKPCFIGSLDWVPNMEGLEWFLNEIWPDIHAAHPQLKLDIAGRNAQEKENYIRATTQFHGEVDDARTWLSNYNVMIVPLLSGSGMRAKIIEAMALGMVVITTTIGLEGIPATHKKEVLVADNAEEYSTMFNYLTEHPEMIEFIGRNARKFVQSTYNSTYIATQLLASYRNYLNAHPDKKRQKEDIDISLSV